MSLVMNKLNDLNQSVVGVGAMVGIDLHLMCVLTGLAVILVALSFIIDLVDWIVGPERERTEMMVG